ncbi:MarR family winged helix-turn-helix transcriptional regulator [Streptomyces sp. B1I3]|uniref:MarR family winged helix-turn-helix transcriptional regulator n=1 Tax=Streptomyces sp. B1I3 TaxID=3042264 RepID=UPI00278B7109|nr:helix-turn-helix domain-containing protein [Streptomyces sp. B1I3]MDQ0797978.1 DNA-binding MarR family transcriptional regulator [Streptomyces sp. B1I3]
MYPPRPNLPQLLLDARRWFEEGLLASLEAAGIAPVSPAQLELFAVLDEEGTTVAELARRMGVARQTTHQAVHGLIASGHLEQVADPAHGRQRLIRRTQEGARTHRKALGVLERLEEELEARIGIDMVAALRAALEMPWGEPQRCPSHPSR